MCSEHPESRGNMLGALIDKHSLWVLSSGALPHPLLGTVWKGYPT